MITLWTSRILGCLALIAALSGVGARAGEADIAADQAAGLAIFRDHLRELLAHRCVMCHGGDATESEFDLTTREGLLKGGAGGEVIAVGNGSASRLVRLLRHDEDPHMPEEGNKLTDEEVGYFVAWIDRGAPYDRSLLEDDDPTPWIERVVPKQAKDFWSFRRLRKITVPAVADDDWSRTPIDRFILAKQHEQGIQPNPEADRRVLLRRAYMDLVGLPPTPEEAREFLADSSPDAYERLIDRLLESPHFGERWARHWLDVARFAESHGFEHDYDRLTAYHYRDFVIRAFNDDLPYNTFVRWQLAGDEYEPENPLAMMATGFLAAGVHATQITKNEAEKHRYDELDDIAATTGTAMLGLTIGCCRCHDHKYDPLPQRDYYQFVANFTTTVRSEQEVNLDPIGYAEAKLAFDAEAAPYRTTLAEYERNALPDRLAAWEHDIAPKANESAWQILKFTELASAGGATFQPLEDGSLVVEGPNADSDTYTLSADVDTPGITALRVEALPHDALPHHGPGRAENGNFALSNVQLTWTPHSSASAPNEVHFERATATHEQQGLPATATIDGDTKSAWAVDGRIGAENALLLQTAVDGGGLEAGKLTVTLKFENNAGHNLGRFRLSVCRAPRPVGFEGDAIPPQIAALLRVPVEQRTVDDRLTLLDWYKRRDAGWQERYRPLRELLVREPKPQLAKMLISSEGVPAVRLHTQGGDFLEATHFLKRGNPNEKVTVAPPAYLQILSDATAGDDLWFTPPPEGWRTCYRRRALAEWITDVDRGAGHLLARVIVNRLWHYHFGRGIVATPSDFGVRGEPPTHPELLDWLAEELIRNDWRLKPIHRLIMQSAVYRQSSAFDAAKSSIDVENRYCWRRMPRRLEAEIVRDAMLAVSGKLDSTVFGPGTLDESHLRRSIYFTVKRSKLVPMMLSFDAPDALSGLGRRATTTVAPQALTLMNNPQVREWARSFAARVAPSEDVSDEQAIRAAYTLALARDPSEDELTAGVQFVQAQSQAYAADHGEAARDLAFTDFCQVLFGLNEFVYVE